MSRDEIIKWFKDHGIPVRDMENPNEPSLPTVNKSPQQNWFIRWMDRITPKQR